MSNSSSCLVAKLSHYIPLSEVDLDRLATLEKSERNFRGGREIYGMGEENKNLYVVKRGWLFSYMDLPDGRRQIVKLHQPGDVIGFPDLALNHMTTALRSVEDVCLCPFPKSAMDEVLTKSPRLSALLLSIALRDEIVLLDLLRALGRMSALERVSYMLLDLISRLRITNAGMTDTIRLPLSQSQIADYLGLTNVYISKTFSEMERLGLIRRERSQLHLLKEAELIVLTDFNDRYAQMDTSWFPSARKVH